MRALRPSWSFLVGAILAPAAFLLMACAVSGGAPRFDAATFRYFQARQSPGIHALMTAVSFLAGGWVIGAVSLACLLACRIPARRADALRLLLTVAGGQVVIYGLKALFHRARREATFAPLGYSFPSGHAFTAVALYGLLACRLAHAAPRCRVWVWLAAVFLILLIGFSRVYLGAHYATDVAAGYAAALSWLRLCWQGGREKRANRV